MTTAFLMIFIAFLLNYVPKIPTGIAMFRLDKKYDNSYPRDQQARLTGFGKRALSAHLNSFEIFPSFAASVLVAHIAGGEPGMIDLLSIVFVVSRIFYIGFYLANIHLLRSISWGVGAGCVTWLFLLPLAQ